MNNTFPRNLKIIEHQSSNSEYYSNSANSNLWNNTYARYNIIIIGVI